MHLAIVQHLEKNDSTRDLESDLMLWNSTVYDEYTTELTKAILFTVISVAKILQSSRALLLPHAVDIFQAHYPAQGGEDYDTLLELGDSTSSVQVQ